MLGPLGSIRVNFIFLSHVGHGNSVVSKWLQLGGGGVIFIVAQFPEVASPVISSWPSCRHGGSVQTENAMRSTGILMVQTVP
jgi:hypothetical protein